MTVPQSPERAKDLRALHAMRRQLGIDDPTWRAMVSRLTDGRTESSGDMDATERDRLLDELRARGGGAAQGGAKAGGRKRGPARAGALPLAPGTLPAKIRALWLSLYHLAEVTDPAEAALAAYAARMTKTATPHGQGVSDLGWLTPALSDRVIRALRGWLRRVTADTPPATPVTEIDRDRAAAGLPPGGPALAAKVWLIETQWAALIKTGAMRTGADARLDTWLRRHAGVAATVFLHPVDADRVIEKLGAWLRRARDQASGSGKHGKHA